MSYDWQCQRCGAPIGPRDQVCLSCERAAGLPPGLQRLVPAQTSCAQGPHGPALRPCLYVPPPRLPGDAA